MCLLSLRDPYGKDGRWKQSPADMISYLGATGVAAVLDGAVQVGFVEHVHADAAAWGRQLAHLPDQAIHSFLQTRAAHQFIIAAIMACHHDHVIIIYHDLCLLIATVEGPRSLQSTCQCHLASV